jgi:hypothetical protein
MAVTELSLRETLIETLHGVSLTLKELAVKAGVLVREVRSEVETLTAERIVETALVKREGDSKRLRVVKLTDLVYARKEAELSIFGEDASETELHASTRDKLRLALSVAFGVTGLRKKTTKSEFVALILAKRAELFPTCSCGEPVSVAGEVCSVCAETKSRSKRSSGSGLVIKVTRKARRPDVALDLTDDELAQAGELIATEKSARGAQRALGTWLASRDPSGLIDKEVLRTLLRKFGKLSAANFTINAKKDKWTKVFADGVFVGWTLV